MSTAPVQLTPINPPLGVNPNYCVNKQTTLVMKEKIWSLSGDTFHIVNENGTEVVQCRGKALSFSSRKEFATSTGIPLFSLRTKHLALHKTFYAEVPTGEILFEVKAKFSIGTAKMIATFTNASNHAPIELLIKGDWFDRTAVISMNGTGTTVATISRSFLNLRQILGGRQTYYVTVAAGVDLAMIAAICVCLDEKENEK